MTAPHNEQPDLASAASVAGLAREIEQLRHRVGGLDRLAAQVEDLAAVVAQRVDTVPSASPSSGEASMDVTSWLDYPSDDDRPADTSAAAHDAEALLAALAAWVGEVHLRYRDATAAFPDCWLWHPEVVEELLWLQRAWLTAYADGAPPSAVGDWHERQRPGVVHRIRGYAGTCALEAHLPSQEHHNPAPVTPTADAAGGDRGLVGHRPDSARASHPANASSRPPTLPATPAGTADDHHG